MKNINRIRKRISAFTAAVVMAVTFMPAHVWADSADDTIDASTGEEIFNELTNPGTPEGYDASDKSHPYGVGDSSITLIRNSRLVIASARNNQDGNIWRLKGYSKGGQPIDGDSAPAWQ